MQDVLKVTQMEVPLEVGTEGAFPRTEEGAGLRIALRKVSPHRCRRGTSPSLLGEHGHGPGRGMDANGDPPGRRRTCGRRDRD